MAIDPKLPPSDAIVALRSFDRRFRAVFTGLGEDEAPDELALRPGPDGWSALAHVVAACRGIASASAALDLTLTSELPEIDAAAVDPDRKPADPSPTGTVDARVSELAWEADALAERAERVKGKEWARTAAVRGTARDVEAVDILRAAVAAGIDHLTGAQQVLDAARRQR